MKQPGLRVKARACCVVRDAYVRAHLDEHIERPPLGRHHVRGREHTKRRGTHFTIGAAREKVGERIQDEPKAAPFEERTEQVDPIGRRDLLLDLRTEAEIVRSIDEQIAGRQGDARPRRHDGPLWRPE